MMDVTFYDKSSGTITRNAFLDGSMVNENLMPNELWIEGLFNKSEYTIENGHLVPISSSEIQAAQISEGWANLKQMRNSLLAASDWTQVPDAPVDQAAWATYRQQLRDLPNNTEDPANPAWPTKPE
jgi:hypothetical protein